MLDRLSVFAGGFGLEAAEEVANPGGELGIDSLEGISSLVDSNLVRATDQRTGEPRFALLETIRQFARERLSSRGEEFEIQARHARYFLALAEKAGPHLRSADQARWSDRLGHERDNLRAAVAWAVRVPNAEDGFRLSAALWRFLQQRGQAAEGRAQVAQLLALPSVPAALRLLGLVAAGSLAYWQGDQQTTESAYDQALTIARELGDRAAEIEGLYNLSFASILAAEYVRAGGLLTESRRLAEQTGDEYRAALADGAMVWLNLGRGDYAAVIERGEPALAALRERGDVVAIGSAAAALAQANRLMGDTMAVAATVEARGDHADALRLRGATQAIHAEIEAVEPPAAAMKAEGVVDDARSALEEIVAERMLEEGRHLTPENGSGTRDPATPASTRSNTAGFGRVEPRTTSGPSSAMTA